MIFDRKTIRVIAITVIVTTIIVIVIGVLGVIRGFRIYIDGTIDKLARTVQLQCKEDPVVYRGSVSIPHDIETYDKKLATTLWDIGGAVSSSNCKEIGIPPPFNQKHLFIGNSGEHKTMYGQAFWNDIDMTKNYACLIFSGTYFSSQWNENLNLKLKHAKELNNSLPDTQAHSGFLDIYKRIRKDIWRWLREHGRRFKYIIVAGRSLGGAISTLCAYDISKSLQDAGIELVHYSFASPRVGNVTFSQMFNKLVPNSFRVFNTEDVVVDLPPPIWRTNVYQHVGRTQNLIMFTENRGNLVDNHIDAYYDLPK